MMKRDNTAVIVIFVILAVTLLCVLSLTRFSMAEAAPGCPTPTAWRLANQAWYLPIVRNWSTTATPETVSTPESVEPTPDCSRPHSPDCKNDAPAAGFNNYWLSPGDQLRFAIYPGTLYQGLIDFVWVDNSGCEVLEYYRSPSTGTFVFYAQLHINWNQIQPETGAMPQLFCSPYGKMLEVSSANKTVINEIYLPNIRLTRRYAPGQ